MPHDEDGYQAVGRDRSKDWWRGEPQNMWQVVAVGLLAAVAWAVPSLVVGRSASQTLIPAAFFGVFFILISAYRLRRRRRH
jgi:hypothetical protein